MEIVVSHIFVWLVPQLGGFQVRNQFVALLTSKDPNLQKMPTWFIFLNSDLISLLRGIWQETLKFLFCHFCTFHLARKQRSREKPCQKDGMLIMFFLSRVKRNKSKLVRNCRVLPFILDLFVDLSDGIWVFHVLGAVVFLRFRWV